MSLLDASHKELKDAVKNGDLVIFAGAGISKNVGLPLWTELVLKIIERINTNNPYYGDTLISIFNNQSSKNQIFDTLNYIERNSLKDFVNQILNEEIFEKGKKLISENKILPLHSKLWQLSKKIITPNYDTLFETCDEFKALGLQPISNKSILHLTGITKGSAYLFKIHGNISEIADIVFYESQYENQYKNETAVRTKLKELVANHPILFVGTSMSDPYINEIIHQVCSMFHGTSAKNFILSNDEFDTADIIKISGDPTNDLNSLIDELLSLKGEKPIPVIPFTSNRIRTLNYAIDEFHNKSMFPSLQEFENGTIQLNEQIFSYAKNRFENKLGPILCQGRWSTGKTVSTLRIGLELNKHGFNSYYLDLADDIAGQEEFILKNYLHKILEKSDSDKDVFIIDNVHLFPEHTHQIAQWAIKAKRNCIFVGRPLSIQFKENRFYYPILFERQEFGIDNEIEFEYEKDSRGVLEEAITSPKIVFTPSADYVKSIFQSKINSIGRSDEIQIADIQKFAESISYNLSFISFHVSKISPNTVNIYETNYKLLYAFLDEKFCLSEFSDELFTIAALSYLDCKTDCAAIFVNDKVKQALFKSKQEHLLERRNFIYGMHSATGRLILDVGIERGLIRTTDNNICYNFYSALRFLLERYLLNKPLNIYEVFFGLSNYEYEAEGIEDDKTIEEARELIYYFLSNPKLNHHYADIIVHRTNSLLKFGFFVKTFLKHNVEQSIIHTVINEETITKLAATFIKFYKERHGGNFYISWHFKYVWAILRKADKKLSELYLEQFPKEAIIQYTSVSIGTFSSILEMALYHPFIDELIFANRSVIIGDKETFMKKFMKSNEIKLIFLMRTVVKMSNGNFKNKNLLETLKSLISPEDYKDFVKSLSLITIHSFVTARRTLGRDYYDLLQKSFDKSFIYKLCYDKPLAKINTIVSESGWEK
ncbi:MAG TPA: SIR2 family protein, partial [Bacteroidia bacterium]